MPAGWLSVTVRVIRPPDHSSNGATDDGPIAYSHTETIAVDSHTDPRALNDSFSHLSEYTGGVPILDDWAVDLLNRPSEPSPQELPEDEVVAVPSSPRLPDPIYPPGYFDEVYGDFAPDSTTAGSQPPDTMVELRSPALSPGGGDEVEQHGLTLQNYSPVLNDHMAVAEPTLAEQAAFNPNPSLDAYGSDLQHPHIHAPTIAQADSAQSARSGFVVDGPITHEPLFEAPPDTDVTMPETLHGMQQTDATQTMRADAEHDEISTPQILPLQIASSQPASVALASSQISPAGTSSTEPVPSTTSHTNNCCDHNCAAHTSRVDTSSTYTPAANSSATNTASTHTPANQAGFPRMNPKHPRPIILTKECRYAGCTAKA